MPRFEAAAAAGQKRKRESSKPERAHTKSKSRRKSSSPEDDDGPQAQILQLETQVSESRKHYNNIATLISMARDDEGEEDTAILAAVSLCRVFSRLIAGGDLVKSKGMPQTEVVVIQWLKDRYKEYLQLLDQFLRSQVSPKQSTALTLLMRLIKEEAKTQKDYNWKHSPFSKLVESIIFLPDGDGTRNEFVEKYFKHFDDLRFYSLQAVTTALSSGLSDDVRSLATTNCLSMLLSLEEVPESKNDLKSFFAGTPTSATSPLRTIKGHKDQAQEAWLAVLRSRLTKEQRKHVLSVFTHQIAPWFQYVEMLADFLADSYDVGGATSLLALSGLFYLMSEKNLDYPSFYQKLYSLLDENLLHSKHRSRFFRLLDTFMSSTHLPAALVASFIKRLSRLALHGPPAGIVVVVPWIYNMFKRHPACTFLMHRKVQDPEAKKELEEEGMDDPFDMNEEDPMLTEAIESSIWEIETLQSHYHPNVATLAKIISEQFTKRSYNLEDFLDHSYNALLDTELNRNLKKEPVVEYEIPKRIFTAEDAELAPLGKLLETVIELS